MRRPNFLVKKGQTIPTRGWVAIFTLLAAFCTFISIQPLRYALSAKEMKVVAPDIATKAVPAVKVSSPVRHELADLEKKFKAQEILGMESLEREKNSKAIRITLNSDVFFRLGTANLEKESRNSIQQIIQILKPMSSMSYIEIEGHTDSSPVVRQKVNYPSNWELSAARAASLIPLFSGNGFFKDQLKIIGYGDSRPLFSNHSNAKNSAKNRRIVLRVFAQEGEIKI